MRRSAFFGRRGGIGAILLLCAVLGSGCAAHVPETGIGGEGDYQKGKKQYDDGHYLEAVRVLDAFRTEHPGSDRVDEAIFYLGMAHQKLGEYVLARDEFERLLRDYPQSADREEAQYEEAMSWLAESRRPALDPEPTQSALDAFQTYLKRYPDGSHAGEAKQQIRTCLDRLAVKAYLNAETYVRLKHPEAAAIYFKKSLGILGDFSRAPDALLGLACAQQQKGDLAGARESYQRLIDTLTPERVGQDERLKSIRERAERDLSLLTPSPGGRP
jgi:outer membrane assembly lipoprotein YfiO